MRNSRLALALALLLQAACGAPSDQDLGTQDQELTVCQGAHTLEGVDVSKWQGTVDWAAVRGAGKVFAVARISDGLTHPDLMFSANYAGIKAAGMIRGSYQFFEPAENALDQANMVLQAVGSLQPGDLPPILDVEVTGGVSQAQLRSQIHAWVDRVTQVLGREPFIYVSPAFWNSNVADTSFGMNPLWIANYNVSCPNVPATWSNWVFWQYSPSGTVAGISGGADLDRFNGSLADLQALAGMAAPAVDAGSPPPHDAGTPPVQDAGAPPIQDAGSPTIRDAGSPPVQDAGSPTSWDAGPTPAQDAGKPVNSGSGSGTGSGGASSTNPSDSVAKGGCGCSGAGAGPSSLASALVALALAVGRRRTVMAG